jgi:hypothetical protein
MLFQFCKGQNLRALLRPEQVPVVVHEFIDQYDRLFRHDIRGTRLNDSLAFDEMFRKKEEEVVWTNRDLTPLQNPVYHLLRNWIDARDSSVHTVPRGAFLRNSITILGQKFQPAVSSIDDSHVIYRQSGDGTAAGSIQDIFSHTRTTVDGSTITQTFFVVRQYTPLTPADAQLDSYRRFPVVCGGLCYKNFTEEPAVISSDQVVCHFVSSSLKDMSAIKKDCILVLPMDKVGEYSYFRKTHQLRISLF